MSLKPEDVFYEPTVPIRIWTHFQDVPPPGYAWTPHALLLHEIDPMMVPLFVCYAYRLPTGSIERFWRQAIVLGHRDWCEPPSHEMKTMFKDFGKARVRPHTLLDILEGPLPSTEVMPGAYEEINAATYWKYKELGYIWEQTANQANAKDEKEGFAANSAARITNYLRQKREKDKYWREETGYRWDHDWYHMMKLANNLSAEEQALIAKVEAASKKRYIGHQLPAGVRI